MWIDPASESASRNTSLAHQAALVLQLRTAGDDTHKVARALRAAAAGAGLGGPAGQALAGLAGRVADDVGAVARGCNEVADALQVPES